MGAVLEQFIDHEWHPIAFFSHKLQPVETHYSMFDRELLGVYLAIRHFCWFLEGCIFHVYTDHKPLAFAISSGSTQCSPRQIRQLAFISEFTTDLRHVHGKNNAVADAFSRIQINSTTHTELDFRAMARAQADDQETQRLKTGVTNLKLVDVSLEGDDNLTLLCDSSQGTLRPVVPEPFRREIFNLLHNLAHPGTRSTCKLISARFVWNGLNRDVRRWTRTCNACQQSKVHRHTKAPFQQFDIPDHRFDAIHVDIVGPLPPSHGFNYLFTCIDRYTRWTEAIPMIDMTAESCARALLHGWISRFGVPRSIMSDCGCQFKPNLWASLILLLRIKHNRTTAYYPQSNGIIERFHRQLKTSLKAHLAGSNCWDKLPIIMLGIWTTLEEDLECCPAKLVYGTTLHLPGEFFNDSQTKEVDCSSFLGRLQDIMHLQRPVPPQNHGSRLSYVPRTLQATHVFIRWDAVKGPLQQPYDGQFPVIKCNDKLFTVNKNGCQDTVSIDRLKPAFMEKIMDNIFPSALTQHPKTHVPTETVQPPSSMLPPAPLLMTYSGRTVNIPIHYSTGGSLVGTNYNLASGLVRQLKT